MLRSGEVICAIISDSKLYSHIAPNTLTPTHTSHDLQIILISPRIYIDHDLKIHLRDRTYLTVAK